MVEGSVQKYLKEVQPVQPGLREERQADRRADAEGGGTKVKGFTLYVVGEGIEKEGRRLRRRGGRPGGRRQGEARRKRFHGALRRPAI
jgi:hypothetical protein